ncbi:MAG: hypothetical protein HY901_17000, partial [Deltaproteobacteria bacterium]|nr:hypothetical protein [Deltaproteobacteria bacterium]
KQKGVPASLQLFAHAACKSGVTGDSEEQPTLFMPAAETLAGPWPMGKNYWVDSDAASVLTCDTKMRRLDKDKSVLKSFDLPFDCANDAELTFFGDDQRYLLKPGVGVVGFTSQMQMTMSFTNFAAQQLAAQAGAPLAVLGIDGTAYELRGYDTESGTPAWTSDYSDLQPAGHIVINRLGQIVFPGYWEQTGDGFVDVGIELYDAQQGQLVARRPFGKIQVDTLSRTIIPTISFDQAAEVAYFAEISDPSQVWACSAVDDATCTDMGGGLKWKSDALSGGVHSVTRTANALVAFGDKVAYFLNPDTGAAITPLDAPIEPRGGLVFVAVVGGAHGATYLLAMGRDTGGHLVWGIKEILIFDKPNQRVVDFLTGTDGFILDVDTAGHAWLWRYDLIRLMHPSEYRQAIGG